MPYKSKQQYTAYMKDYMKKRWADRRKKAIDYLGGKCEKCGATDDLEFDHRSKRSKEFTLADFGSKNEKDFHKELKKCRLLCRPCHYERTAEQNRKVSTMLLKVASRITGMR
jgi:5-methylcytosine-specific restriction endonuclease McrA